MNILKKIGNIIFLSIMVTVLYAAAFITYFLAILLGMFNWLFYQK